MTLYLILRDWIDIDKLNYNLLCINPNSIEFFKKNPNKINWNNLSFNENAIELLNENQDKINWDYLSRNTGTIELLKENLLEGRDKINWHILSFNENAIELLSQNKDKIDWYILSRNPSIFTYDYKKIKDDFKHLREEILAKVRHPDRLFKLMKIYDKNEVYNTYF